MTFLKLCTEAVVSRTRKRKGHYGFFQTITGNGFSSGENPLVKIKFRFNIF